LRYAQGNGWSGSNNKGAAGAAPLFLHIKYYITVCLEDPGNGIGSFILVAIIVPDMP